MDTSMQNAGSKVAKTVHHGASKGKEMLNAVADQANDARLQAIYESSKEQAQEALEATQGFIKKYPVYTALGVAAVGILAGFILTRASKSRW